MQASENKPAKAHDDDLLRQSDIPAFRTWLLAKGLTIREPSPRDLKKGLIFAIEYQNVRLCVRAPRERKQVYARTDVDLGPLIGQFLKRPVVAAVSAIVRPPHPVQTLKLAADPAPVPESAPVRIHDEPAPSLVVLPLGTYPVPKPAKRPLTVHEQDLRDDFAIHAPLLQRENESLRDFAIRRWEYAGVMMEVRPV